MLSLIIVLCLSVVLAEKIYRRTWVMLLMTVAFVIGISTLCSFLGYLVLTYADNNDSGKWLIIKLLMSSSTGAIPVVAAMSSVVFSSFVGSIIAPVWAFVRRKKKLNSLGNLSASANFGV